MTFAEDYQRESHGWIIFPRDIELRRKLFPAGEEEYDGLDVFDHPAKMNIFLLEALVEYLTQPGDWVLDPFGGTGTTMYAASCGRNALLCEVEESFWELQRQGARKLLRVEPEVAPPDVRGFRSWSCRTLTGSQVTSILGDNRQVLNGLKAECDAAITSPPYSTALNPGSNPLEVKGREGTLAGYTRSAMNLGVLNPFLFEDQMKFVWQGVADCLKPGAKLAVVTKDIVKGGQRELLSAGTIRQCRAAGLDYLEWHKWKPPGTIRQETARNKGGTVIEDEDIIIFEKAR